MRFRSETYEKACFHAVPAGRFGVPLLGGGVSRCRSATGSCRSTRRMSRCAQILTEWARVGKTHIVNVERIAGGPITLKLDAFPEKQALDIVLRAIPGYIALPRATQVADASLYDRIVIMATTSALVAAPRPQQPTTPTFPGMQMGGPGVTQLRPQTPLMPGMILEGPNADPNGDQPNAASRWTIPRSRQPLPPVSSTVPGINPEAHFSFSTVDAARRPTAAAAARAHRAWRRIADKPVERTRRYRAARSCATADDPAAAAAAGPAHASAAGRPISRPSRYNSTDAPSDETRKHPCPKSIGTGRRTSAA